MYKRFEKARQITPFVLFMLNNGYQFSEGKSSYVQREYEEQKYYYKNVANELKTLCRKDGFVLYYYGISSVSARRFASAKHENYLRRCQNDNEEDDEYINDLDLIEELEQERY